MGMKVKKNPKKGGKDTRPWGVKVGDEIVVRCWYRETAQECLKHYSDGKVVRVR